METKTAQKYAKLCTCMHKFLRVCKEANKTSQKNTEQFINGAHKSTKRTKSQCMCTFRCKCKFSQVCTKYEKPNDKICKSKKKVFQVFKITKKY